MRRRQLSFLVLLVSIAACEGTDLKPIDGFQYIEDGDMTGANLVCEPYRICLTKAWDATMVCGYESTCDLGDVAMCEYVECEVACQELGWQDHIDCIDAYPNCAEAVADDIYYCEIDCANELLACLGDIASGCPEVELATCLEVRGNCVCPWPL